MRATMGSIFAVKIAKATVQEFLALAPGMAGQRGRHPADRHRRSQKRRLC
ncbi:hypothetical protein ACRAWD_19285 [Caulobacter segnis]